MNDISVMAWSLATLAALAVLEFFGLRAPMRDGLTRFWRLWSRRIRAKWAAFRAEVRAFVAWVYQPDPPAVNGEDVAWVEYPITVGATKKSDTYTYRVTWDDGEPTGPTMPNHVADMVRDIQKNSPHRKKAKRTKPRTRKRGK